MSAWNDPWSTGFDWGTVEADPDLSAALQERTDQRDSARAIACAFEQRLAEVKRLLSEGLFSPKGWRTPEGYMMQIWALLDGELMADD